jgi:hypothetical protein
VHAEHVFIHRPPVDEAQPVQRRDGQGHLDHVEARVMLVEDPCNDVILMPCGELVFMYFSLWR